MYKVTQEQMDDIIECMNQPVNGVQDALFEALNLNPYDNYDDDKCHDYILVVREDDINSYIEEQLTYPEDCFDEGDSRLSKLLKGEKLSEGELKDLRESYIEQQRDEISAEYMIITQILDNKNRKVFAIYSEIFMGQGGINIAEFFGFYATEEEASLACQNLDGLIVDKF